MVTIGKFKQILKEKFPFKEWEKEVEDNRKRPIISVGTIFKLVTEMVIFEQQNLLEVDNFARRAEGLAWHKSNRKMVASDTTIQRSLEGFNCEVVRKILKDAQLVLEKERMGGIRLPSGRQLRFGVVDGSEFGGFPASVLTLVGMVNAPVDVELYSKGKELEATRNLLKRVGERFGNGFVDIISGDGLYMTKGHLLQCKEELGCEALIKTSDESLTIIQDAKGVFFGMGEERGDGIERIEGVDINRNLKYQVIAASGFSWQEIPFKLKVGYVREEQLKPKKGGCEVEEFWVITTDESLGAEDIRELAHKRWEIENNVFKRLNSLVKSKRRNTHKAKVKEAFLLMWFVGLILLGFYIMWMKLVGMSRPRQTWKTIAKELLLSLGSLISSTSSG
jgi:hypothetical protein